MKPKILGILIALVIVTTVLCIILLAIGNATAPEFDTLAARISYLHNHQILFMIGYLNAGLITGFTIAMMAGFYVNLQPENPLWAAIGFVFVPIYGLANLVAYFSQLFVVPRLLALYAEPATAGIAELLLAHTLHDWPGSAVGFVNGLAYAALAIPSIIYGLLLWPHGQTLRIGGLLLAVSGFLSLVALAGYGIGSNLLAGASILSAVVFLVGLVPLAAICLRASPGGQAWIFSRHPPEPEPRSVLMI